MPPTTRPTTRGPLPPSVYWRRRLFVLGTVLGLVLIVVNLVRGGDDPVDERAAASVVSGEQRSGSATGTDDPGGTEVAPSGTTGPEQPRRKGRKRGGQGSTQPTAPVVPQGPTQPVLASPEGDCDDADVAVVPSVTRAVAGQPVTVSLALRTQEAEACTWRVTDHRVAVTISLAGGNADPQGGAGKVWASHECPTALPSQDVVVRSAVPTTITFDWNARYSEPGCPEVTDWADEGEYQVHAAAYGGEPSTAEFDLVLP